MAVAGTFISWPDHAETQVSANVARSHPELSHYNSVAIRPLKTYVFWASPMLLAPAEQWFLNAASVEGLYKEFDPAKQDGLRWEHSPVQADGLTTFRFSANRSYVFYLTPEQTSEADLKGHELPWTVYVCKCKDIAEAVCILFPVEPLAGDAHGVEYAGDFDLLKPLGMPQVFNSAEHAMIEVDAQRLVDYYALHGLIDGGALIRTQPKGTVAPVTEWDILPPDPTKDPTQPYGYPPDFLSYHWHYILSEASFSPDQTGDPSTIWASRTTWTPADLKDAIATGKAVALSLGQIVMLAGDYFQSLDEMRSPTVRGAVNVMRGIADGKRLASMIVDVTSLPKSSLGSEDKGKKDFMEEVAKDPAGAKIQWKKVKTIADTLLEVRGPTKYSEIHTLAQLVPTSEGRRLTEIERLIPWAKNVRAHLAANLTKPEIQRFDDHGFHEEMFSIGVTNGQYAALALENEPHFDPWNWDQFARYQGDALQIIKRHLTTGSPKRHPIPADAVASTAFGLHFLTDSFSAGHMRVPRAQLGLQGALAAKLMHDTDGYYGLLVKDGFGNQWRAYGDGKLRKVSLDGQETKILDAIKKKGAAINTDPDANWERVKAAVGAAFKQLHYEAQRYYSPPPTQSTEPLRDVQSVLGANRTATELKWDYLATGDAAGEKSLDQALAVSIQGKLDFMRKYVPAPNPVGKDLLDNHPPLFSIDGSLNTAASAYFVEKPTFKLKRVLCLKWHTAVKQEIKLPFSDLYYLAKFTVGASKEGWITKDDNRVVTILDTLPEP
jgi:hypothetical protein